MLSKQEDKALYDLSEEFQKKGALTQGKQEISAALLSKDSEIDRLIYLNQIAPQQLTDAQRAYLDRELKIIAASYNISVENLYNVDFSKTIKRDDSALKTYLNSQNALHNSYDMKQAQSLKEGLEAAAFLNVGNVVAKVGTEAAVKAATAATQTKTGQRISQALSGTGLKEAGIYLANTAKQHPLLTEKVSTGILSGGTTAAYDLYTKGEVDLKNTMWSASTGFVAGGNGLIKTTAINSTSAALQAYTEGGNPLYAAGSSGTATIGGYAFGKGIQKGTYNVVAGNMNPNMKYYEKQYLDKKFLAQFGQEYQKAPNLLGIISDNIASVYIFNKIQENNYIQKWEPKMEFHLRGSSYNSFLSGSGDDEK